MKYNVKFANKNRYRKNSNASSRYLDRSKSIKPFSRMESNHRNTSPDEQVASLQEGVLHDTNYDDLQGLGKALSPRVSSINIQKKYEDIKSRYNCNSRNSKGSLLNI